MSHCTDVTDNALEHLAGIHTLRMVECTRITGAGLAHLRGIHSLHLHRPLHAVARGLGLSVT